MGLRPSQKEDGGYWEFPGGKKEFNETIENCLHREIMEELNVQIDITKRIYSYNNGKYLLHFFIGSIKDEENIQMKIHEELKFVDVQEICKLKIFDGDKELIKFID